MVVVVVVVVWSWATTSTVTVVDSEAGFPWSSIVTTYLKHTALLELLITRPGSPSLLLLRHTVYIRRIIVVIILKVLTRSTGSKRYSRNDKQIRP